MAWETVRCRFEGGVRTVIKVDRTWLDCIPPSLLLRSLESLSEKPAPLEIGNRRYALPRRPSPRCQRPRAQRSMRPPLRTLLLALIVVLVSGSRPRPHILRKRNPSYVPLRSSSLDALAGLTDLDTILNFKDPASFLSKLLIPRAAGSTNLTGLQTLVTNHFTKLGWHVERDHFESMTPYGLKPFTNLIFTHDPLAVRRIVLSAHLDSKFYPTFPENQFVGATDSAAPCALLLDLAQGLTEWLEGRRVRVEKAGGEEGGEGQAETLQIVFFDGEEAFKDWTATDSIYGARFVSLLLVPINEINVTTVQPSSGHVE